MSSSGVDKYRGTTVTRPRINRRQAALLRRREAGGQFQKDRVRPVEIRSRGVYGVTNISAYVRQSIVDAFIRGVRTTLKQFMPHVAWDTGAMAGTLREATGAVLGGLVIRENYNTLEINWADIERPLVAALEYPKHHILGHAEFNPAFTHGYKDPTTPGTRPIDPIEFMGLLKTNVRIELPTSVIKNGMDAR